ncbi:MAG: LacI family DNA-binding transcriptional regulator [Anaerolineales bacterium]|nr:LacI family DNA-binding transcriptional regulator [Anaerolineales bacterium]
MEHATYGIIISIVESTGSDMAQKRVTIVEIAKEAGVSAQTVSRVVNGHSNVAETTRQQIQEIIDRLGYHPSRLARSLLQGRSHTIGIVSYGLGLFGPSQTLAGIVNEANQQRYSVLPQVLNDPKTNDVDELIGTLIEYHVDGIIWAIPEIGDNRSGLAEAIAQVNLPCVFINSQPRPDFTVANIDNLFGGRVATQHLIDQGYRAIGLISGPSDWWEASERMQGWRETMALNGLAINEALVKSGDWSAAAGERAMCEMLNTNPEVEAVFACNDSMALGAIKAGRAAGRRIPDDLAVIGFDDVPEAAFFTPALSTIRQPFDILGSRAVAEVERQVQQADIKTELSISIKPTLIVRSST